MTIPSLPKDYNFLEREKHWQCFWETEALYSWDPASPRADTFVVDTPPLPFLDSCIWAIFVAIHKQILWSDFNACWVKIFFIPWDLMTTVYPRNDW